MIPIRQYYTEDVINSYWLFINDVLKDSHEKTILEKLLKSKCSNYTFHDLICGDTDILQKVANDIGPCTAKQERRKRKKQKSKTNVSRKRDPLATKHQTILKNKYKALRSRTPNDELVKKNKSGINSLVDIIDLLGITVCPYCNRSFIYSTIREKSVKTTCQLDHFLDKDHYPYLSLSLFNLIPVCSSCNHSKQSVSFKKSPLDINDVDEGIKFSIQYAKADYTKQEAFQVALEVRDKGFCKQEETLGLTKLYEKHNDIGHELFLKQHIYSEDRIMELCESFPELFTSPNEVRQLILGNYIDKKDVGKRPLAKMTRDIMMQLGFIEE